MMKIITKIAVPLLCILFLQIASCKKPEGPGGTSSITGKVWVKKMGTASTSVIGEYPGAYEDVYIIYGNDAVSGNKVKTNPDGIYEFKYLEPGNYKVYVYTRDSTGVSIAKKLPIIKEIQLKKKQNFDAGTIQVYR